MSLLGTGVPNSLGLNELPRAAVEFESLKLAKKGAFVWII
jgi:hypothetical protein